MTELNTLKRKEPADLWRVDLAAFTEELEVNQTWIWLNRLVYMLFGGQKRALYCFVLCVEFGEEGDGVSEHGNSGEGEGRQIKGG